MRKTNYILTVLAVLLLASCYQDKGNYDYIRIGDIEIEELDGPYVRLAAIDKYEIRPQVTTTYPDSELVYTWEVWNAAGKRDTIARGPQYKSLEEVVGLSPGSYKLYYYVQHTKDGVEGFSAHIRTDLTVNTEFSTGFFILKETPDGDTDIDMVNVNERLATDIIANVHGASLPGKPRDLGMLYSRPMIDWNEDTKTYANCISLITYDGNVSIYRADDMMFVYDKTSMFYEPDNSVPYKMFTGYDSDYLCEAGIYHLSTGSPGSGLFGLPGGETGGGDHHAFEPINNIGLVWWDETGHRLLYDDYYTGGVLVTGADLPGVNHECLFMGSHTEIVYAIFRNKSDNKLYQYTIDFGMVTDVAVIEDASKIYGAVSMSTNETDLPLLYIVNDNKLYIRNLDTGVETTVSLQGIDSAEQLSFVGHRYFLFSDMWGMVTPIEIDYLAVATQSGGNYKLYLYETFRGTPEGQPALKTSGTGIFKDVKYLDATLVTNMDIMSAAYGWGGALFDR